MMFFIFIHFEVNGQIEKFNIIETEITKENTILYKKSYISPVKINQRRDYIEIITDSITFHSFILKNVIKNTSIETTRSLITAKREQVFYVKEFTRNKKYYLVVIPIKLRMFHKDLGGHGLRLLITDIENVSDTILIKQ